jgi:hypothetical protein
MASCSPKTPRPKVGDRAQHVTDNQEEIKERSQTEQLDISRLRLPQDFASSIGVKKLLITVPVRKPGKQDFVRVHPDEGWRLQTAVLELKEEREIYLVDQPLWNELVGEISPRILFTAVSRQGVLFLWPVRLPGEDGRIDNWSRSAQEAAMKAMDRWVRVSANMSLGAYEIFKAVSDLPDPEWPEVTFQGVLEIAFRDRFIKDFLITHHSQPV